MFTIDSIVDGSTLTLCLVGEMTSDIAYLPWETAVNVFTEHHTGISSRTPAGSGICQVVLDLYAVTFTDTTGLTALVRVRELADTHGAGCQLRGVQPRTRRLLEMTGLLATFDGVT